jgi:hypothetical protein
VVIYYLHKFQILQFVVLLFGYLSFQIKSILYLVFKYSKHVNSYLWEKNTLRTWRKVVENQVFHTYMYGEIIVKNWYQLQVMPRCTQKYFFLHK